MPTPCHLCRRNLSGEGTHPNRDMHFATCACCGSYFIDRLATEIIPSLSDAVRYSLIAAVRAASDQGRKLELDQSNLAKVASSAPRWRTLLEGIDRLLLLLANRASGWLSPVPIQKSLDYPLICARGEQEVNELLVVADKLGFLQEGGPNVAITVKGWQRIDELRATQPDSRQAFVAMWFDVQLDDAWLQGFKDGIERSEYYTAVRVDSVEHNQKIDDRIIAEIRRSGLVVADFTGQRGGVYFEAGYAHGLGIPIIWTCRSDHADSLHFDTRQYNHIIWSSPSELADRLHERIAATVLPQGWAAS